MLLGVVTFCCQHSSFIVVKQNHWEAITGGSKQDSCAKPLWPIYHKGLQSQFIHHIEGRHINPLIEMHLCYSLWQKSVLLPFTRQHRRPPRPKAGEFILQVHQSVLGRRQLWYAVIICRIRRHRAWIEIQGALTTKPAHFTGVGVSPRDPPFPSVGLFLIQGNSAESLSLQQSPYLFLEHISSPSVGISSLLLTLSGDKGNSGGAACYLHWILLAFVCPEVWFISLVVSFGSFWTVIQACKAFLRLQCHSPTPTSREPIYQH